MNKKEAAQQWYILAYDIREKKRLQRIYYYVKKKGIRLQRSVFILRCNREALDDFKDGIYERVSKRDDDVRLYPVRHPNVIWAAGNQAEKISNLFTAAPSRGENGILARIRRLFNKEPA